MSRPINQRELRARLNRRQVLLGLSGGVTLGLPLLRSLRAHADQPAPPKRLVLMYTPNGVIPDGWWPSNVRSETSFDLGPVHQPLAPFRERLTLLAGVDLKVTNAGPGGLHQKGIGGLFTGRQLQAGTVFVDGCGQTAGWADGISVDQEVAKAIGQGTLLPSLELGVRALDNDVQGRISYAGAGQPLPPINNPLEVYNRLFSMLGSSTSAIDALRVSRRSVLDTVQSQFSTLSPQLSGDDRKKLAAHLELVRDVERRLTQSATQASCSVPNRPATLDPSNEADMPQIADLELDMLAAAFACDLTRVASFQISTSLNRIRYPWLNSLGEGHALSHAGPSDTDAHDQLIARQTWHSGRLAYLLSRLGSIQESDGTTVLDNTLVLWGNEVALGYTHAHENMPFLMAGGRWHFRTGRYITYQGASHNELLVSILNAMGVPATSFGQADLCKGPLGGLT
jgi:hypothetical protein